MIKGKNCSNLHLGPPLLEQLGALCSLLAHDLANQLCVISGSASYAQLVLHDPQRLGTALETITRASETAGYAVSSFGEYRRTLPTAFVPGLASEVVGALTAYAKACGWKCVVPSRIVEGSVLLPPQWAVFAASGIKMELRAKHVTMRISKCRSPVVGFATPEAGRARTQEAKCKAGLLIQFTYSSPEAFSIKEVRARYENLGLLAVFELNRMLGGEIDGRTPRSGAQEIDLWLPFHA